MIVNNKLEGIWKEEFMELLKVLFGGKVRPGRAADHSTPSSVAVMEK